MQEVIKKKDLLMEVKLALTDTFVAEIAEEESALVLRFLSGQTFRLALEEEK